MLVPIFLRSREQTFFAFLSRAASTIVSISFLVTSSSSFFLDLAGADLAGVFFNPLVADFAIVSFVAAFLVAVFPFFSFDVAAFTVFSAFSSFSFPVAVLFFFAATLLVFLTVLFLAEVFDFFSVTSVILTISL